MMIPQRSQSRLLALLLLVPLAQGAIGSDGLCPLFVFVPFTVTSELPASTLTGQDENLTSQGFSHMSAALLAIEHFNSRNATVVPQLANLTSCNVRFDTNLSRVLDSSVMTHLASESLLPLLQQEIVPCAIAGPFHDLPAEELSVLAVSAKIPLVAQRAYNVRVASDYFSPYSSQVYPTVSASARKLVEYLQYKGRTNYIGFLFSLTITGTQRRTSLTLHMDALGMDWVTSSFVVENDIGETYADKTALEAMKAIKEAGYRTIVVSMESRWGELQPLADAAEELGMNQGDYFWVWFDNFQLTDELMKNSNVTKLVAGSAWLVPLSGALLAPETDPFAMTWYSQGKEAVDRLNAANPINPGEVGYIFADDDWFQTSKIEIGSAYMYDAVMSVGIGACLAEQEVDGTVSSAQHQEHVRKSIFTGATGPVAFGNDIALKTDVQGGRLDSTLTWGALNMLPPQPDGDEVVKYSLTEVSTPDTRNQWSGKGLRPFVYRDGRTVPPELLRDEPDQNYLSSGLRAMGFALMGTALLCSIVSAGWVFVRRKHRVLRASQPVFLYLIAFGSAVQASSIITISNDESYGWSTEALSRACTASTWLLPFGTLIIYSALFTKLWRVNKVLQFSRRRVLIRHVAAPMVVVVLAALLVLSLWSGLDPLWWHRVEINDVTGESIGECTCNNFVPFVIPLIILVVTPAVSTAFMAWKTIDVDDQYAESKWIFILILLQLEVLIVSVPMVIVLRGVSTTGRYLGFLFMVWIFPMSTILLIMLPKFLAYRRANRGVDDRNQKKRGESRGIVVSGACSDSKYLTHASNDLAAVASRSERSVSSGNGQHEADESNDVALSASRSEHNTSSGNGHHEVHESNDVAPIASQSELNVSSDVDEER